MKTVTKGCFSFIVIIWLILWIIFIMRENKPGEHADLKYLYTQHSYTEKIRYIMGEDFFDFLTFCKNILPEKASYSLNLYRKSDFEELRARYFLWPLVMKQDNPDFKISYQTTLPIVSGYELFKQYNDTGFILIKEK